MCSYRAHASCGFLALAGMTNDEPPITPLRGPPAVQAGSSVARHLPLLVFSRDSVAKSYHWAHGTSTWVPSSWVARSVGWVYLASVPTPSARTALSQVSAVR